MQIDLKVEQMIVKIDFVFDEYVEQSQAFSVKKIKHNKVQTNFSK